MQLDSQIKRFVNKIRFWIFIKELIHRLFWCLSAGLLAGGCMELLSCLIPWYHADVWTAATVTGSVLVAVVWSVFKYPSPKKAALQLDRTGFSERTVTALELAGREDMISVLQKQSTWDVLSQVSVVKQLKMTVDWKKPALVALCGVFLVVTVLVPTPAKRQAEKLHEVEKQVEEQIEKIEEVKKDLEEEEIPEQEELETLWETMIAELEQVESQEALEKALERVERKLEQVVEKTDNDDLRNKLQQLASSLQKDISPNGKGNENSLELAQKQQEAAENAQELLQKLEELQENAQLSEEDLQAAKEALENLAQLTDDAQLAESLESLAGQIGSGQLDGTVLASAQAAAATAKLASQALLASVQSGQNSQSGSGNQGKSGTGNGSGNGSGSGSGNGSGNGSGTGNGSGNGTGSGNGSGNGSGSGNGGGWNFGGPNGQEESPSYEGEMVAVPNAVGDDENTTGTPGEGTSYLSQGGQSLTWSGTSVPYDQVAGEYKKQALSQIENSDYPAAVQEIIKEYFEQMN